MWVKDTVLRLSSWMSPLGWRESKATICLWPRSRRRMVVCSCQTTFKNLFSRSTIAWLKCSWTVISMHCRITEEHSGKNCRKLVSYRCTATLQKARRFTESQSGIARCVELCQKRQGHTFTLQDPRAPILGKRALLAHFRRKLANHWSYLNIWNIFGKVLKFRIFCGIRRQSWRHCDVWQGENPRS